MMLRRNIGYLVLSPGFLPRSHLFLKIDVERG